EALVVLARGRGRALEVPPEVREAVVPAAEHVERAGQRLDVVGEHEHARAFRLAGAGLHADRLVAEHPGVGRLVGPLDAVLEHVRRLVGRAGAGRRLLAHAFLALERLGDRVAHHAVGAQARGVPAVEALRRADGLPQVGERPGVGAAERDPVAVPRAGQAAGAFDLLSGVHDPG